ncbi:MAG: transposase [Deferribacteraceae bacterium]|jgi:putative transposase|nr:transposase [Deferribacteraceae bacterium]
MNKAYKFRLYPNTEQQILFAKTFGCVRFIYNRMLGDKIRHYEETKKYLKTTPAQYKKEFEWLKEVDSLALANAQLHLEVAYKNFFRDKNIGFPKFKSKHKGYNSYTTNLVNGNIMLINGYLKLPKLGLVKVKQHRDIPDNYKLKSVTVSKKSSGKYYVSILYEYESKIIPVVVNSAVGLDFSMKELYVSSEGQTPNYPRPYRQTQAKLAKEQRKLSKRQKGGKNRAKQKIKVARLHEKVANQRSDFLHKQSRQITNALDAVCVEDLNMQGMSQVLNFGKSVSDNGWGMFVNMLAYKLLEQGKQFVKIDKWFPSSKMCSVCGIIKPEITLSERTYRCDCGLVCDRDVNAAINIKNEGIRIMNRRAYGDSLVNISTLVESSQEAPASNAVRR